MQEIKPCLVVLSGRPLSGKSTVAHELTKLAKIIHIDVDDMRQALFPNPEKIILPPAEEKFVMVTSYTELCRRAHSAVAKGFATVITGTFSRPEFKKPLLLFVHTLETAARTVAVHIFQLNTSDADIPERIAQRRAEGSPSNIDSLEKYVWSGTFFEPISFVPVITMNSSVHPEHTAYKIFNMLAK